MNTKQILLMVVAFLFCTTAFAEQICVVDLNGDGKATDAGETGACLIDGSNTLCPLDAVNCNFSSEVCPLDNTLACNSGSCTQTKACATEFTAGYQKDFYMESNSAVKTYYNTPFRKITKFDIVTLDRINQCINGFPFGYIGTQLWIGGGCAGTFRITGEIDLYRCSLTGQLYEDNTTCNSTCSKTDACTSGTYTCPTDSSLACFNNAGVRQCSPSTCADIEAAPPPSTAIDTKMLVNDGATNPDGSCAAEVSIFNGKPSSCKTEGVKSAFRNCCAEGGEVISDNYTGTSNVGLAIDAISLIHTASVASWAAYDAYVAAGVADASGAASTYFGQVLAANSAALGIGVGIAIAAYYYANACSQGDMETATYASSKMCHLVGYNCTDKWLGSCVQEERSYCCYNSKIGRIIHEQGRPQLKSFVNSGSGIWGAPDNPICRGFKPEEFQALDFSQIDLSEYYADIAGAANTININTTISDNITEKTNAIP